MQEVDPHDVGDRTPARPGGRTDPGAQRRAHAVGLVIGNAVCRMRDALARGLIALSITPNALTVAGLLLTGLAALCLVKGAGHVAPWEARWAPMPASWWPSLTCLVLLVASATDMLDGAVARLGNLSTRFGAILDSTLDRVDDLLIYFGCAIHFSLAGNTTYVTLSLLGAGHATLISYIKARAENLIEDCSVGFWQRGERCALFLAGLGFGHLPAALWLLGTLPLLTVARRFCHSRALATGGRSWEPSRKLRRLMPWRDPRGSPGYDLCAGIVLLFVIIGPFLCPFLYGGSDPLASVLSRNPNL